jgi:siderophore synthetase component
MVTIVFSDENKTTEFYLFKNSLHEIHQALHQAKARLEAFNYKIIASIIESIDEHFSKDNSHIDSDITYH